MNLTRYHHKVTAEQNCTNSYRDWLLQRSPFQPARNMLGTRTVSLMHDFARQSHAFNAVVNAVSAIVNDLSIDVPSEQGWLLDI